MSQKDLGPTGVSSSAALQKNEPSLLQCFSYLHPPFVIQLDADPISGFEKKNVVLIKDKCSYARCNMNNTVAFCGGVESNYLISKEVCLLRSSSSTFVITSMSLQRIGAAAVFIEDILLVAGGRTWSEGHDTRNSPYCRPLELSDTYEIFFDKPDKDPQWKIFPGVNEVRRYLAAAVSIGGSAYLIGGFCINEQLKKTQSPSATDSIAVYSKRRNDWSYGPSMRTARGECGAAVVGDDKIFVAGGMDQGNPVEGIVVLNVKSGVWVEITSNPPWPLGPSTACIAGNKIYVVGQLSRNLVAWDTEEEKWIEVLLLPHLYEFIIPSTNAVHL